MPRTRLLWISVLFCLTSYMPFAWADASQPEACPESTESLRQTALQDLVSLETAYQSMNWHVQKSWETVYQPLWDALQKQRDPMSSALQAEGEMLFGRYRSEADSSAHLAAEAQKSLEGKLSTLSDSANRIKTACPAWDYQSCMQTWYEKMSGACTDIGLLLREIMTLQAKVTAQVAQSLKDTPSDHEPYGNRMQSTLQVWDVNFNPRFLALTRTVRELLELRLFDKDCCKLCTQENIRKSDITQTHPLSDRKAFKIGMDGGVIQRQATGPSLKALEESIHPKTSKKESD